MSRNELCHCGSGKRFKHCHGRAGAPAVGGSPIPLSPRDEALAAHRAGSLGRADELYRRALAQDPADVDVRHMLGVVLFERMRYREAVEHLAEAARRTGWATTAIRHNLGLALAKFLSREANARQEAVVSLAAARQRAHADARPGEGGGARAGEGGGMRTGEVRPARVGVVLLAQGNFAGVEAALDALCAQTRLPDELVVVDAGLHEGAASATRARLATLPFAARMLDARFGSLADAANAGARAAGGDHLAFAETGVDFLPARLASLVDAIARGAPAWGHARIGARDARGELVSDGTRVFNYLSSEPGSFSLVDANLVGRLGNLFVAREMFDAAGGFDANEADAAWGFAFRASAQAEPVAVDAILAERTAPADAPSAPPAASPAPAGAAPEPALQAFADALLARALAGDPEARNPLAPQHPDNHVLLMRAILRAGQGGRVPVAMLAALVARCLREGEAAAEAGGRDPAAAGVAATAAAARGEAAQRNALVVLGMHRSGTSALSRVLNLCGATLPERVMPAKLGVNPKGFWEPEAVNDLDIRVLRQLGGEWDRPHFRVPDEGGIVDEFLADAGALLRDEYGEAPLILIKDPRIGLIAPLWQRALAMQGYRPTYVIPVRSPLEVARSLEARGDMGAAEGVALWLAYMARIEAFADERGGDALWLRYPELLDDWRGVVARVAARLGVAVSAGRAPAEVDAFLDADLRNQQADDATLHARLVEAGVADPAPVEAMYRRALARCVRDAKPDPDRAFVALGGTGGAPAAVAASPSAASQGAASPPASSFASSFASSLASPRASPRASFPTAAFVLCIEQNAIREQALLLCESIRSFAGRHRDARILAYAPRPGLGVDAATRARLAELDVGYVDEPLNIECSAYGSANRVAAARHAEAAVDADYIVVLDSDTVWLGEPELPDADVAARAVDEKGSATAGAGDRFEAYWRALAALAGVELECLPWMRATVDGARVRASYNGGLVVARRASGVLGRWAELFYRSVREGLRPFGGSGVEIVASTGAVGRTASEFWGSNQAALALAMWGGDARVVHYGDRYNVPLHLLSRDAAIEPRWRAAPPLHVHYHGMFGGREHGAALELLERLGVPADRRDFLAARVPFGNP